MGAQRENPSTAGFALVALLAAMPLMISVLVGLSLAAMALKNRTELFATCRAEVWNAQKDMSQMLRNLVSLNPRAKALRAQRKLAEAEVKAARASMNPPLIAAAETHRALILNRQMYLRAEQERILFQARARRAMARAQMNQAAHAKQGRVTDFFSPVTALAVERFPPHDLTPDHTPKPGFAGEQKLQFRWHAELFQGTPEWLLKSAALSRLRFNGECSATLKEEKESWRPQLVAAKSSRK